VSRILALSLADFALERARKLHGVPAEAALVLAAHARGVESVAAASRAAHARGVRSGMSVAHARALLAGSGSGGVAFLPWDPTGDRAGLERLGTWAMRFSPRVAVRPPTGLLLEIAGTRRLFGEEADLAAAVARAFADSGHRARIAVADTIGCAWAVASHGDRADGVCVPSGAERTALAPLPLAALRLEEATLEGLRDLGIERVGELFELARDGLPARFGPDLLLRLDQALGEAFEPFEALVPVSRPRAVRAFEVPVADLEVVSRSVAELAAELTAELARRGEGVLRLELTLLRAELEPHREELVLCRPSADLAHLRSLLERGLERTSLGAGVERIELAAARTAPLVARQLGGWRNAMEGGSVGAQEGSRALGELVDTLTGRLGRERVVLLQPVESHLPERAFRRDGAAFGGSRPGNAQLTPHPRPSRLFARPEELEVALDRDRHPRGLRWRGVERRVVRTVGPERIEMPWWSDARRARARDYFRFEDEDGRWLWVGRETDGRWFVHGEWE